MKITIDTHGNKLLVEGADKTAPDDKIAKYVSYVLRKFADRLCPSDAPHIVVNEDKMGEITEEMHIEFLTHHEGNIH